MKPFRIPLVGPYISRIEPPSTDSGIVGIGVVGLMVVGQSNSATTKDARYVNVYSQTVQDPTAGGSRVYAVKRPGFATQSTPASGSRGYAILVWTGNGANEVISAFGDPSTIYNGTTSLGAVTGKATGISETFVSSTPTLVITSDDNTAWYYDTALNQITDGDFPGNAGLTLAGTFAHIDGYACIMTTNGVLWASDLNSLSNWTATSFDSANAYPDSAVGCVRHRQYIIAFGTESMEFFYNAGLTPFPLAKATALTQKVGSVSADAIAQIADTTFWCGSTPQGGLSIFQYDGKLSRISTPEIDSTLVLSGANSISLSSLRFGGRSFVLVKAGSITIAFCVEEKFWHEWSSDNIYWYKCAAIAEVGGSMVTYTVSNNTTSGKVYVQNQASPVYTDDGTAYTARIQLPPLDFGTKKMKFWHDMEIVGDTEETSSAITLLYTDDDYQNYVTHATLNLNDARPRTTRLGSSRRRGWVLTHAASTAFRLETLEGSMTVGGS